MEQLQLASLSFTYPGQSVPALNALDLSVQSGDFVLLIGPSGSGKSTLLRQLKPGLAPHGVRSGRVLWDNVDLEQLSHREQSQRIGFVGQDPEHQLVTQKVESELAFSLESLGRPPEQIQRRVAEAASFFGLENLLDRTFDTLSGGQKQLVNLAAAMTCQPDLLLLDEPTSQLDPVAAAEFLSILGRINRELGVAICLTEHRLEEVFPLCTQVWYLDRGAIQYAGPPDALAQSLLESPSELYWSLPGPMQVWCRTGGTLPCPVSVSQGKTWLTKRAKETPLQPLPSAPSWQAPSSAPVIHLKDLWFRYRQAGPDVLKGLDLAVYPGELFCLLGGNGAGKSTVLRLLAGLSRPQRGKCDCPGSFALLPQDPQILFSRKTVLENLTAAVSSRDNLDRVIRLTGLEGLLERHPYDLSGGEQQRAALAIVLLQQPEVLLLDEPTKGLDGGYKQQLGLILKELTAQGVTIVLVSHDVEFCAAFGDRCALLFGGRILAQDTPRRFFSDGSFYTTAASRMSREILDRAVTSNDLILACGAVPPEPPALPVCSLNETNLAGKIQAAAVSLPRWRRVLAAVCGLLALAGFLYALRAVDWTAVAASEAGLRTAAAPLWLYLGILALLVGMGLALGRSGDKTALPALRPKSGTLWIGVLVYLLAVPLTIWVGSAFLGNRRYLIISFALLLETLIPAALLFEQRKLQARELVLLGTLCALGVAGRAAFIALPGFKPVLALVIISGVAYGAEAGFTVGAVTMLVSNMLFGQGPWTPWQMLAMGLCGWIAGLLSRGGILGKHRAGLCVYGVLASLVIYGGIMNPAAVLLFQPNPTWPMILTGYLTGFAADLIQAAATALFLWFFSRPMLEKLERIRLKYGLLSE